MVLLAGQSLIETSLQVIVILFVLHAIRLVQRWHRLRHIPGPNGVGWSSWWQLRGALSGRYHEHLKNVSDQFGKKHFGRLITRITNKMNSGPLVRIGPNELLSTDPVLLRSMSAVRSTYTKGDFYTSGRIVPNVDNVVSERDEVKHKAMRAKMAPGVSDSLNHGHLRVLITYSMLLKRTRDMLLKLA